MPPAPSARVNTAFKTRGKFSFYVRSRRKNRDQKKSARHAVMKFDFSVFFCLRFKVFSFFFLFVFWLVRIQKLKTQFDPHPSAPHILRRVDVGLPCLRHEQRGPKSKSRRSWAQCSRENCTHAAVPAQIFPEGIQNHFGLHLDVVPVPIEGTKATVELYLCDISGHGMFRDIVPRLLEGVSLFILVYDQCSRDSFEACDAYLRQLQSSNTGRKVRGSLVGNFSDEAQKEVSVEEARAWADARGLAFFETSALPPGTKAEAPFRWCAESFHKSYESRLQEIARASS